MHAWYDVLLESLGGIGFPSLGLWYMRDRKKTRADAKVAEGSTGSLIKKADAEGMDAQLLTIDRAFGMERGSLLRTIAQLEEEVAEARAVHERTTARFARLERDNEAQAVMIHRQDDTIRSLRAEVATLTARINRQTGSEG